MMEDYPFPSLDLSLRITGYNKGEQMSDFNDEFDESFGFENQREQMSESDDESDDDFKTFKKREFPVPTETDTDDEGTISRSPKRQRQQGVFNNEREESTASYSSYSSHDSPTTAEKLVLVKSMIKELEPSDVGTLSQQLFPKDYGFSIIKELESSDVDIHSQLLLPKDLADLYILPALTPEQLKLVKSEDGMKVITVNLDKGTQHELTFRLLSSTDSYVLTGNWTSEFVKAIPLSKGDIIGMDWHQSYFVFRLPFRPALPDHQLSLSATPVAVMS